MWRITVGFQLLRFNSAKHNLLGFLSGLSLLLVAGPLAALPPLGLTQVESSQHESFERVGLEVIQGIGYISVPTGVWTVDSLGSTSLTPVSHPTLGNANGVTRVINAVDDELYMAANFGDRLNPLGGALYRLSEPTTPIMTWETAYSLQGVDRNLNVFGNTASDDDLEAVRFLVDGTIEPLAHPSGPGTNNGTTLSSSTPSGNAIGFAGIPGTLGIGPVKWEPNGDISFIFSIGLADSVRDRADGKGANIGWYDFAEPIVSYGDGRIFAIFKEDGSSFYDASLFGIETTVSQGDFSVVEVYTAAFEEVSALYGFFPGIVPGFPDRAVPLLDIFPELASIDIDYVHDLASVDGYLYMTLSGDDGTFLFGARDPSVIPEPAALVLWVLASSVWVVLPKRDL